MLFIGDGFFFVRLLFLLFGFGFAVHVLLKVILFVIIGIVLDGAKGVEYIAEKSL